MKDYTILAKFLVPVEQSEVILRDSMQSGIMYAGCYLLQRADKVLQNWDGGDDPISPRKESEYPYVVAYEDWGNVSLKEDATVVTEDRLDQQDYCRTYTGALLRFQAAINVLLMEMNTVHTINTTQEFMTSVFDREREEERKQAAKEEFEQHLAEDPPMLVK